MARLEEQKAFEAARTAYALCLALETNDSETLNSLRSMERSPAEWRAVAEQAITALVTATRVQVKGCGVTAAGYFKSSIQALLSLEALGAPPGTLSDRP